VAFSGRSSHRSSLCLVVKVKALTFFISTMYKRMQAQVTNASRGEIFVALTPTSEEVTPEVAPIDTSIPSGSTRAYHVNTGTMNLFIRTQKDGEPVWQGPVPTRIRKPLVYSEMGVSYDGMVLPSVIEENYGPWKTWIWAVILVLILLGLGYWYLRKRSN